MHQDRTPWLRRHPQAIAAAVVALGVLVAVAVGLATDRFLIGLAAGGIVAIAAMFLGPVVAFLSSRRRQDGQRVTD
jgi:hypothetical protein